MTFQPLIIRRYLALAKTALTVVLSVFSIEVLLADANVCCGPEPNTNACNTDGCNHAYPGYCAVYVLEQIANCCGMGSGVATCTRKFACGPETGWCVRCDAPSTKTCGTCTTQACGGGGCDPMGTNQMNCEADYATWEPDNCYCNYTPIVIQLRADGPRYQLTSVDGGVLFDHDGDGVKERTAWTVPAASEAFLTLDRDGSGQIESGAELFGNSTRLPTGEKARNGFEALAAFDGLGSPADGMINQADPVFHELRLWFDRNHNGGSEADELSRLDELGIVAIDLAYTPTRRRDENGNMLGLKGRILVDNGRRQVWRKIFDIFFATRPAA